MNKTQLRKALRGGRSVRDAAEALGVSPSTVYRRAKVWGVPLRSKSKAQKDFLKKNEHQRAGTKHTDASKELISRGVSKYSESTPGKKARKKTSKRLQEDWKKTPVSAKRTKLNRLNQAKKPRQGELSRLGRAFKQVLDKKGVSYEVFPVTLKNHVTDFVIETPSGHKIAIELIGVIDTTPDKLEKKMTRLESQLQSGGYQVVLILDKGRYPSHSRALKLYSRLQKWILRTNQTIRMEA